jgi:spore photoproduct lyase
MFQKIFVEKRIFNKTETELILNKFPKEKVVVINDHRNIFDLLPRSHSVEKKKKNLILADYDGLIVKEAPPAYGFSSLPHFYFIHAKNCIYECQYCFLQGYFKSPDILIHLNYDKLCSALKSSFQEHSNGAWYHAGEFSDSLALSSITNELPYLFNLFKSFPNHFLELRTKSANIKSLLKLKPTNNIIVSFSLSPKSSAKDYDLRASSVNARIAVMKRLAEKGYILGIHFDPIIYSENYIELYSELINEIVQNINVQSIKYFSIGTVRFTKEVFQQLKTNYPDSNIFQRQFIKGFDGKFRYHKPLRKTIQMEIKERLIQNEVTEEVIYFCMEDES